MELLILLIVQYQSIGLAKHTTVWGIKESELIWSSNKDTDMAQVFKKLDPKIRIFGSATSVTD